MIDSSFPRLRYYSTKHYYVSCCMGYQLKYIHINVVYWPTHSQRIILEDYSFQFLLCHKSILRYLSLSWFSFNFPLFPNTIIFLLLFFHEQNFFLLASFLSSLPPEHSIFYIITSNFKSTDGGAWYNLLHRISSYNIYSIIINQTIFIEVVNWIHKEKTWF